MVQFIGVLTAALLYNCLLARAWTLRTRDTTGSPPLSTVDIPLILDSSRRYITNVTMSPSAPQQFGFVMSMGTGYTVVAGTACDSCGNVKPYNEAESKSASNQGSAADVHVAQGTANGTVIKEDCVLRNTNGSGWSYPNQTVVVANQSQSVFDSTYSGVIGLGLNRKDGAFGATPFSPWFARNPTQPTFSWGMLLNSPYSGGTDGGTVHWVVPNSDFHQSVTYKNVTSISSDATGNSDWMVDFEGYSFQTGQQVVSNAKQGLQVVLDNFYPDLYIPQDQARLIHAAISGATQLPTTGSGNNTFQTWAVPCDTKMTLAVTFGTQPFVLTESDLIQNNGGQCVSKIQGWGEPDVTEYLFGGSFISSIYLIYVVNRPGANGSNSNDPTNALGFALRSANKKSNTGIIVGATVGGVALILALVLLTFLLRRRINKKRTPASQEFSHSAAGSYDDKSPMQSYLPSVSRLAAHPQSIGSPPTSPMHLLSGAPSTPGSPGSIGSPSSGSFSPYVHSPAPSHAVMSVERNADNMHGGRSPAASPATPARAFTIDHSQAGSASGHTEHSSFLDYESGQDVAVRPFRAAPTLNMDPSGFREKRHGQSPPSAFQDPSPVHAPVPSPANATSPTDLTSPTVVVPSTPPPHYSGSSPHSRRKS